MPKIVVKKRAEIYKEFPIRPFQTRITIGSEGDNDLIIADKKVSMHHLVIEKEGTNYFVTDKESAFGTYVNGRRVHDKVLLISGDEITIGEHTLMFENILFEKEDNGDPFPATKSSGIGYKRSPATALQVESVEVLHDTEEETSEHKISAGKPVVIDKVTVSSSIPYYLLAIYGPYLGKKYQLTFGVTKIGRDKTLNDIVIRENSRGDVDPSISRRHATIFYENNEFYITDKRSKTRTKVNQELLHEDSIAKLNPGDEIEIISDQKSTIFRLVPEGLWDYAPPKKTGDWWIRYLPMVTKIASGIIIFFLLIHLFSAARKIGTVVQAPSPFKATEQFWLSEQNPIDVFNKVEDMEKLMSTFSPLLGDLDGDGINDLVYINKIGYLHVVNGAKHQPLWQESNRHRIQFPLSMVMADLNGNDLPDVIIPTTDSRIYALDGRTGTEIWISPLIEGELSGPPVVADINGDRIADVLFCNKVGVITIGYGTYGDPIWEKLQTDSEIRSTPSAGDFNDDGIAEVAIGTENGEIFIINGVSKKLSKIIDVNEELQKAKGSFFEDHQLRGHIAIGDLDNDNADDLVFSTLQGSIMAISGKTFKRLWSDELISPETTTPTTIIPIALGDLDGDKKLDVVIFTPDNKIITYRGMGQSATQKKILWGFMSERFENFIAHPVIGDVNKDGCGDVIAAGLFNGVSIFHGKNGKLLWQQNKNAPLNQAIISTPLLADLGGDKNLDILIRNADNKFSKIVTNSRLPKNTLWWGQVNFDASHTGCFRSSGLNSQGYILSIIISLIIITGLVIAHVVTITNRRKLFVTMGKL